MKRLRFHGVQNVPLFKSLYLYNFFAFLVCIFSNEKDPAKKQDFVQVFGIFIYIIFAYPVIICWLLQYSRQLIDMHRALGSSIKFYNENAGSDFQF